MAKVTWGINEEEPDDNGGGFQNYDGPKPPVGVYTVKLKRLVIKKNSKGDNMLNGLLEIAEPKGSEKAKYNGYGIWFNQNVTDQGKPFVKQILTAFGATWKDFLSRTVAEGEPEAGSPAKVTKFAGIKVESEPVARIGTKNNEWPVGSGEVSLQPSNWLPKKTEDPDTDDDADDDGEEDAF